MFTVHNLKETIVAILVPVTLHHAWVVAQGSQPGLFPFYNLYRTQDPSILIIIEILWISHEVCLERWHDKHWERWRHNWKPFVLPSMTNNALAPAAVCISKQLPFFACTTCRKLTLNASKCTNVFAFWQRLVYCRRTRVQLRTKFGLRGMPGGSY